MRRSRGIPLSLIERPDDDFDNYTHEDGSTGGSRLLVCTSHFVRKRIRHAIEQTHAIIVQRIQSATRPNDTATEAGLIAEIRTISEAKRCGLPGDVRAARLAAAASLILLAEMDDRPEEPKRGAKRAEPWQPTNFTIPEQASEAA